MKQFAPATQKNKNFILPVLKKYLPKQGNILEISSGTGEHCVYFAPHFPRNLWLPSDINPNALESIEAWSNDSKAKNIQPPFYLDVTTPSWFDSLKDKNINSVICINMIHIAPWEACLGLMKGAGEILKPEGILYLYGAYKRHNRHTTSSNENFDQYLQAQNPTWGVRNLETVVEVAKKHQLKLQAVLEMPSNNLSVIFAKIC